LSKLEEDYADNMKQSELRTWQLVACHEGGRISMRRALLCTFVFALVMVVVVSSGLMDDYSQGGALLSGVGASPSSWFT
jgi:hypothetical protein